MKEKPIFLNITYKRIKTWSITGSKKWTFKFNKGINIYVIMAMVKAVTTKSLLNPYSSLSKMKVNYKELK